MKLLICTSIDISEKCAAVNRLNRLINSLKPFDSIICYSDKLLHKDSPIYSNNRIIFPLSFPRFLPTAFALTKSCALFYTKNLNSIIQVYDVDIILVYSTFSILLDPIINIANTNRVPVIADGGEFFSISIQNLINGVNYMQYTARLFTLKRLSGLSCCSSTQLKYSRINSIPSVFFPGFMPDIPLTNRKDSKTTIQLHVVSVCSFHPRENLFYLIKAVLKAKSLGLPIRLTIVGKTSSNFIQKLTYHRLKNLIQQSSAITVTDFVSDERLSVIMNSASIFVLLRKPSKETANTFPTRVPEYLAYKKPLILCDVIPFTDFFTNYHDALFVSHRHMISDLITTFFFIYNNPRQASVLASNASATANRYFSSLVIGKRIYHFFRDLL